MKVFYQGKIDGLSAQNLKDVEKFTSQTPYITIATHSPSTGVRLSMLNCIPHSSLKEAYFLTDTHSDKVKNLLANPNAEIAFTNGQSQVILTGNATVLQDLETKKAKWQPYMIEHFPGGAEDKNLCVLKFIPQEIRTLIE